MGSTLKKGSQKGVSRRCLERPLGEHDPFGVHPILSGAKKEPQSQKIARTAPKNFLNNSRALPSKTRVLRQITPESSPERSAKSLSQKFFGVPFLSLKIGPLIDC